jgi:4-amino-4-deoxy-L-arabinose transferase-like glycosyltransferase
MKPPLILHRFFKYTIYNSLVSILLLFATVFYTTIWLLSQHKLIYTDEIVFAADFMRIALGQWLFVEIPHPPLYTILGSLSTQLFGYNLPAMRLVGVAGYLLTLWLIPPVCYCLTDDPAQAKRASLIAVVAWAIHPLALQGSLLLDIDNTIFPPVLLLFVLVLSTTESSPMWRRVIYVGAIFAVMLWVKLLPSTLLLAGTVLITYVARRQHVLSTLGALVLGALVFAASLAAFSLATEFPLEVILGTFARTQNVAQRPERLLARLVMGGGITAVWVGIPLLAAFGVVAANRFMYILRGYQPRLLDALILYAIAGFGIFTVGNELPMGFPRYHYPLVLIVVIIVCIMLAKTSWFQRLNGLAVALSVLCCVIYFAAVAPDPLLPHYALTFETNDLITRLTFGLRNQITTLIIPLAISFMICWIVIKKWITVLPLVAFCVAVWLVTSATQTQAAYSTIYEYGRIGGREMAELVRQRTQPADKIIAPKEILWAAQREGDFVVQLLACTECTAQSMTAHFDASKPAAYVLTTKEDGRYTHITRNPQFTALLERCFSRPVNIGSYIAYFRTQSTCG